MKNVVVFCGSSLGNDKVYEEAAYEVGATLAREGIGLVFGGANVGLMGVLADATLGNGGQVTGVFPRFLQEREIAHEGLTELILVDTMHERKTIMSERADGVIALPGGFGTMEELFEMLTWGQLGLHHKPMGILNTNGFYDDLIVLLHGMVDKGFLKEINQKMLLHSDTIVGLLALMKDYEAPKVGKWISKETT